MFFRRLRLVSFGCNTLCFTDKSFYIYILRYRKSHAAHFVLAGNDYIIGVDTLIVRDRYNVTVIHKAVARLDFVRLLLLNDLLFGEQTVTVKNIRSFPVLLAVLAVVRHFTLGTADTLINITLCDVLLFINQRCDTVCDLTPIPKNACFLSVIECNPHNNSANAKHIIVNAEYFPLAAVTAYTVSVRQEFSKAFVIALVFKVKLLYPEFSVNKARTVIDNFPFQSFFNVNAADYGFFGDFDLVHRLTK